MTSKAPKHHKKAGEDKKDQSLMGLVRLLARQAADEYYQNLEKNRQIDNLPRKDSTEDNSDC